MSYDIKPLLLSVQKRFGDRVYSEGLMSRFLIAKGFRPRGVMPEFPDLPVIEYVRRGLRVSFSKTSRNLDDLSKDKFLVLRARHDKENYTAVIPLDNIGKYLDSKAA